MRDPRVDELVQLLAKHDKQLRALSTAPRLAHASLEAGTIPEYDLDGQLVARYGQQPDTSHGTYVITGPTPATPTAPTAEAGPRTITAIADGTFVGGASTPLDLVGFEVYAAATDFEYIEDATLVGWIPGEDGGRITFARPAGEWHIALVAVTTSVRRSAVSARFVVSAQLVTDSVYTIEELDAGVELMRLNLTGSGLELIQLYDEAGELGATMDGDGNIGGKSISASENLIYRGVEIEDRIADAGGKVLAQSGNFPTSISAVSTTYGLTELEFNIPEGPARTIKFKLTGFILRLWSVQQVRVSVRITTDGSRPMVNSTEIGQIYVPRPDDGSRNITVAGEIPGAAYTRNLPAGTRVRALLTMARDDGSTNDFAYINSGIAIFSVMDEGPLPAEGGLISSGGGALPSGGTVPPPTVDPVTTKTLEWDMTHPSAWWETWENGGSGGATAATYVIQGSYGSYSWVSRWGWGTATASALANGDPKWVEVRLKCLQSGSGSTTAVIGTHGSTSAAGGAAAVTTRATVNFAPGEEKWVRLTVGGEEAIADACKSGSIRGVGLGGTSYGRFDPSRLAIRIRYEE